MSSEHLQLLIAGYVLGDLDSNEAAEFEQLLRDYPAIADEVTQMQTALELSYDLPEVEPPTHLRSVILNVQASNVQANEVQSNNLQANEVHPAQSTPLVVVSDSASRNPFFWSKALNLAAAVLILVLGVNNYRLWQTLQASQTETQRLAALNYSLKSTEPTNPASATVAVNPNSLEAVLTVKGLAPLPPGKVYVLWTIVKQNAPYTTDSKGAIMVQAFNVDAQGSVAKPMFVPRVFQSKELVTKVAVTIEDAIAPQKHQGTPIMVTSL